MYSNKRIFKDKGIIVMSVVSVMAITGLVAGIMLSDNDSSQNITKIAELESSSNTEQDAAASVKKQKTTDSAEEISTKETETETEIETENLEESFGDTSENSSEESQATVNAPATSLSFTNESILSWPVETTDIIIDFSMDSTTYFPTLDMYKTSDSVCIRSEIGSPVYAAADGVVSLSSYNEEIGHFISMDLGNEYELTYGQLKDIQIEEGSAVSKGDLIGYISEPTKYYTVEGANLYLKLTNNGVAVDPLDYLNYDKP